MAADSEGLSDLFWTRVKKGFSDECWRWKGWHFDQGYAGLSFKGRLLKGHRLSYELNCGPIPAAAFILHSCDNRGCVNPAHLRIGDHKANMADMRERKRAAAGATNYFGRVRYIGEQNARARLTEEAVRDIRFGASRGVDLARKYNVSKQTVSHIRAGRIWRHVSQ